MQWVDWGKDGDAQPPAALPPLPMATVQSPACWLHLSPAQSHPSWGLEAVTSSTSCDVFQPLLCICSCARAGDASPLDVLPAAGV